MNRRTKWNLAAGLFLELIAGPVLADGILEQIQTEIAGITQRSKSAVVTIEDARALVVSYDTSPLKKRELQDKVTHLSIDKDAADKKLSIIKQQYNAGVIDGLTLNEAQSKQDHLTLELNGAEHELKLLGHVPQQELERQSLGDQIALLTLEKKNLDKKVTLMGAQVRAGLINTTDLIDVQANLARTVADLASLQQRKNALNAVQNLDEQALALIGQRSAPKSGTGFSIGEGYIVTTADVLQGMDSPIVLTDSGLKIRAKMVGINNELNIGLVKLLANIDMPALKLGDSGHVAPGHFAITLGNQTGQNNVVALNLVSAIRNEGTSSGEHFYPGLIEIGGTVGAGASGAPLIDAKGEVIGMLAAVPIASDTNSAAGWQAPNAYFSNVNMGQVLNSTQNASNVRRQPQRNLNIHNFNIQKSAGKTDSNTLVGRQSGPLKTGKVTYTTTVKQLTSKTNKITNAKATKAPLSQLKTAPLIYGNVTYNNSAQTYPGISNGQIQNLSGALANNSYAETIQPTMTLNGNTFFQPSPSGRGWQSVTTPTLSPVVSAGYAIPINDIVAVITALKSGKPQVHGWIGVDPEDHEKATEKDGVITVTHTVTIRGVFPDAPAITAGVEPGDMLVSLNGRPIHTSTEIHAAIIRLNVGDSLTLVVHRTNETKSIELKIAPRPAQLKPEVIAPVKKSANP